MNAEGITRQARQQQHKSDRARTTAAGTLDQQPDNQIASAEARNTKTRHRTPTNTEPRINLNRIRNIPNPAPNIRASYQRIGECISLSITWAKIALHHIFPSRLFSLQENTYDALLKPNDLTPEMYQALAETLEHGLEYLKEVANNRPRFSNTALGESQKQLIYDLCDGPASDVLLNIINFCLQESQKNGVQDQFLEQIPIEKRRQVQDLINTLQQSGLFARAKDFSKHLTPEQQKQMIRKMNTFPFRQMQQLPKIANAVLETITKEKLINTHLLNHVIQGQTKTAQQDSHKIKIPTDSPIEMMPKIKKIVEASTKILDLYERASREAKVNPLKAAELHQEAAQELNQIMMIDGHQVLLPTYHYLLDIITEASALNTQSNTNDQNSLRTSHTTVPTDLSSELSQSRVLQLAQAFNPHISKEAQKSIIELCTAAAGPIQIMQALTDRLSPEQEDSTLRQLFNSQPKIAQHIMHICLNTIKTKVYGQRPEKIYTPLKPLETSFNIKQGCEFAHELLSGQGTATEFRKAIQNNISFIRNILSQTDYSQALIQISELLPESFRGNIDTFFKDHHLEFISTVGKHILPHINDTELSMIINQLPITALELASQKTDSMIQYLGDPDNNLTITLAQQKNSYKDILKERWLNYCEQYPILSTRNPAPEKDESDLKEFLENAQIYTDNKGQIADHRFTTIKAQRDIYIDQLRTDAEQAPKLLGALLADMGLEHTTSNIQADSAVEKTNCSARDELIILRSYITQYSMSEELYHIITVLLPAVNDPTLTTDSESHTSSDPLTNTTRKSLLAASFKAIAHGIEHLNIEPTTVSPLTSFSNISSASTPQTVSPSISKESINMLWKLTKNLINSTDRTIIISDHDSHIIFMEDGSCVNTLGELLPKGDVHNITLRQQYSIDEKIKENKPETQEKLRTMLKESAPDLIQLLATHPTDIDFNNLLTSAHLPKDVKIMMVNLLDHLLPKDLRESTLGKYATFGMQHISPDLLGQVIDGLPLDLFDQFADQATRLVNELDPYEQMPFFKYFADQLIGSLGENQAIQDVAEVLTKGYYTEICHADRRALTTSLLELGCPEFEPGSHTRLTASSMQQFVDAMTQAGGPCFQKAMQLFKGDIHVPSIRDALAAMNSEIKEMPRPELHSIIQEDLLAITQDNHKPRYMLVDPTNKEHKAKLTSLVHQGILEKTILESDQLTLLGSATIAQTHRAYLWECDSHGEMPQEPYKPIEVAIKVQRPHIKHRIQREMNALMRMSNTSDSVKKTLEELKRSILGETAFSREFQFGKLMKNIYTANSEAKDRLSPKVQVVDMIAQQNRILIQSFSNGQPIDTIWSTKSAEFNLSYGNISPALKQQLHDNPNHIQVTLDRIGHVTGLQITHLDNKETKQLKVVLPPNDPLRIRLQEISRLGTMPEDKIKTTLITQILAHEKVQLQLKGSVSLKQQAEFLHIAGQRLETLVGHFAHSAFVGVKAELTHTLQAGPPDKKSHNNKRKIFVEQVLVNHKQYWQFSYHNNQGKWQKKVSLKVGSSSKSLDQIISIADEKVKAKEKLKYMLANVTSSQIESPSQQLQRALTQFTLEEQGSFNNALRSVMDESFMFQGESFIDSDRHDGNLLFQEKVGGPQEASTLKCIDTGAGTIVTAHERIGMVTLGTGIAFANATATMNGLSKLIPDLDALLEQKDEHNKKMGTYDKNNPAKKVLLKELNDVLIGETIMQEKAQDIFQFLLSKNLLEGLHDQLSSKNFFQALMPPSDATKSDDHQTLRNKIFTIDTPKECEESAIALKAYLNNKRSIPTEENPQGLPPINFGDNTMKEFQEYLLKLSYGRILNSDRLSYKLINTFNPVELTKKIYTLATDKHNALLFIKSIRNIANVLNKHNIYAPESIIQLNRGTKFIGDQIQNINDRKDIVLKKAQARDLIQSTTESPDQNHLQHVNLGSAYLSGILPIFTMTLSLPRATIGFLSDLGAVAAPYLPQATMDFLGTAMNRLNPLRG